MGVAGASPSQLQPQLQPQHAYDHSETFVLYARELQARDERIAALETALARAEEGHRAEVLALRGELHSTQAELRLQVQVSAALSTSTCPAAPLSVFVDEGPINVLVCSRCRETGIVAAKHSDLPTMDSEIPVGVTGFEREGLTVESSSEATKSVEMEADAAIGSTVEQQRSSPPNVRVSRYSYNHRTQDDDNNINTRAAQPIPSSHVRSTSTSASTAATPDDKQEAALRGGDLIDDVNDTTSTAATSGNNKRRGVDGCTATPGQVAALFSVPLSIPDENENGASSVVVASDFGSNENTATPAASNTALPASNVTGGGVGGGTLALSSSSGVGPYTAGSAAAAAVSALLSDYGRTSAQVQMLAQDLLYYKKLAEEALQAKAEETMAAREAATVAVQACMRRADCEQQLGDAKEHLLDLQRRYARLSLQCESEQRHNYGLKARLQVYAQKLSALEVDYSHSLHHLEDLESAAAGSVEN